MATVRSCSLYRHNTYCVSESSMQYLTYFIYFYSWLLCLVEKCLVICICGMYAECHDYAAQTLVAMCLICSCRHGKYQVRVCCSQGHNSAAEPEGVQLSVTCMCRCLYHCVCMCKVYACMSLFFTVTAACTEKL